jgi:hypothetical protein
MKRFYAIRIGDHRQEAMLAHVVIAGVDKVTKYLPNTPKY